MKHPFLTGTAVGALGLLAWYKRGWIVSLFRRMRHPFSGAFADPALAALPGADPGVALRQIRRYAFAASQDQSPIVGLTHASYALVLLDTTEEMIGRDKLRLLSGLDPSVVRAFITQQQDRHATALHACDPYLTAMLKVERGEGRALPGIVPA
jgi:hypothetical protein